MSTSGAQTQGLLDYAVSLIGTPYAYGGTNLQSGVDCSGFTQAVFNAYGIQIGRDTSAQRAQAGQTIGSSINDVANAQPGDLLFFGQTAGANAHVGIYLGNGLMVDAPHTGGTVRVDSVAGWDTSGEALNQIVRVPAAGSVLGPAPATPQLQAISGKDQPAGTGATLVSTSSGTTQAGVAPNDTPTPRGAIDTNAVNAFISAHPELAWVMSDPELGGLMQQAVAQGWDATKWQAALEGSNWWKTHSSATRDWIELVGTDPAEAARRVQEEQHNIQATARNLGVNLNDNQLASLATQTLEFGWDTTEIGQHLAQLVTVGANGQPQLQLYRMQNGQEVDLVTGRRAYYGPQNQPGTPDEATAKSVWGAGNYGSWKQPDGTTVFYSTQGNGPSTGGGPAPFTGAGAASMMPGGGQIGATAQQLTQLAHQYLVPLADSTITQWATQIATGQADQNSFQSYLAEQAKSLFPGMAAAIDSGVTPTQYVDPYRQLASRVLGVAPDSIDFTQPQWLRAVQQVDPKSGQRTSMSLTDWMNTMMADPTYGYDKSQNAQDRASSFAQALGQMFGKSPSGGTGWSGVQPLRA